MMNAEFKKSVLEIKNNHKDFDYIDAMVEKFEDFVDRDNKENRFTAFLNKLEDIDERCLLVRLFCNYHYQVNNGGHYQYFDNGYASSEDIDRGCFGKKTDECDLHKDMIRLVKKYFPKNDTTIAFVNNLEQFTVSVQEEDCYDCDGNGTCVETVECEECGGSGYIGDEECGNCGGSGSIEEESECWTCNGNGYIGDSFTIADADFLDKRYYDIEDDVLKVFNDVVYNWLTTDTNVLNEFENAVVDVANSKPKAKLKLVGTDGNAFAIMGKVIEALRNQKVDSSVIEQYKKDAMSGNYDNLLATSLKYCEDANIEVC